jgi:hypothetical protein
MNVVGHKCTTLKARDSQTDKLMRHNDDSQEQRKMRGWAAEELKKANLGDARLNQRLVKIVEKLAAQAETTVNHACGSWAQSKGHGATPFRTTS